MGETRNVAEVASKVVTDIFSAFRWAIHPKKDENFDCVNPSHLNEKGAQKTSHPADAVFHYEDPYRARRMYLHADLKSYGERSISSAPVRNALRSLAMTVECARQSEEWRERYLVDSGEAYEVHGLLLVHNHDHGFQHDFKSVIDKIDFAALPLAKDVYLHYLGPQDLQRLFSIANDIMRLRVSGAVPADYAFHYPDLVLSRRHGDGVGQAATVESLVAPYFILKYQSGDRMPGYVIYYNRAGHSVEEFEYFLDSLSRFQMLEPGVRIQIRMTRSDAKADAKSLFHQAKVRYAKAWGFEQARQALLEAVALERITAVADNYSPGFLGWEE